MWNDDWRTELDMVDSDCMLRLCECRNTKRDIKTIAKIMAEYNPSKSLEECLDRTLEWLCDWNSQIELYPDTPQKYNMLLNSLAS